MTVGLNEIDCVGGQFFVFKSKSNKNQSEGIREMGIIETI